MGTLEHEGLNLKKAAGTWKVNLAGMRTPLPSSAPFLRSRLGVDYVGIVTLAVLLGYIGFPRFSSPTANIYLLWNLQLGDKKNLVLLVQLGRCKCTCRAAKYAILRICINCSS